MIAYGVIFENLRRDSLSGDGRLALMIQGLVVFFIVTLTLIGGTIQGYLGDNFDRMLGADVVLESHAPLSADDEAVLASHSQGFSRTMTMPVVMTHDGNWSRAQLKVVDGNYPLQGDIKVSQELGGPEQTMTNGPGPGKIWLSPRLAGAFEVNVGDELVYGGRSLQVGAILLHEPDRLMEGHSVAPRAMVGSGSVDTEALEGGSLKFRYLVAAEQQDEESIERWQQDQLPAATLLKKRGGNHPLAMFWQRTENVFGLLSVVLVILAAVALDMTNRRWLERMQHRLALYLSFGVSPQRAIAMMLVQWVMGFLAICLLFGGMAGLAQIALIDVIQETFPGISPVWPAGKLLATIGLLFGMVLILQLPFLLPLARSSVSHLIREEGMLTPASLRLFTAVGAVSLVALNYTDNWLLTGMIIGAVAVSVAFLILMTWLSLNAADRLGARRSGLLPFAFFLMRRRLAAKTAQVAGLGICAMLLLTTLMLLNDLGDQLESHRRTNDGNLVIAEATESQVRAIDVWSQNTQSEVRNLRPFVQAKLMRVNDLPVADHAGKPSQTLATLHEPIRLHWTDELPDNNSVNDGRFWQPGTDSWQQVSVEEEVMTDLGLDIGDLLTFQVGPGQRSFTVVSSHIYQQGGSSVTFWFQVPASARPHIPADTLFMGSMEIPPSAWSALPELWAAHPSLMLVPLKEITERFDRTLKLVTGVAAGFAAFVLALTLMVVAASVKGFEADDRRRNGLLQSMGLKPSDCIRLSLYEWAFTAIIAAVGAIAGTWLAGILMFESQFGLPFYPDPFWIAGTITVMVAVLLVVGVFASRRTSTAPVKALLE